MGPAGHEGDEVYCTEPITVPVTAVGGDPGRSQLATISDRAEAWWSCGPPGGITTFDVSEPPPGRSTSVTVIPPLTSTRCSSASVITVARPRKEPPPASSLGWPPFSEAVARVERQITSSGGPYLLGSDFTAADVMSGGLLRFAASFGMYKPGPVAAAYLAALEARPAMTRAKAIEEAAIAAAGTSP